MTNHNLRLDYLYVKIQPAAEASFKKLLTLKKVA